MQTSTELPTLRGLAKLGGLNSTGASDLQSNRKIYNLTAPSVTFYDAKFYPYTDPGLDPFFAVAGDNLIIVCRVVRDKANVIEVLKWFTDDKEEKLHSIAWSQDLETGEPLVCVAGDSGHIKVLNVITKELTQVLSGHGGEVNDLAISPISPAVLASGSRDHTIRIWNLDCKNSKIPCQAVFGGSCMKAPILSVSFHQSGKYLLSAGMDHAVNLWTLPDFQASRNEGKEETLRIDLPHFSTKDVHTNFADCVKFYGDLIVSKAANEDAIVLWRIDGFSSTNPTPPASSAINPSVCGPTTLSAFGGSFERLLQFECLHTGPYYMRFDLFHVPNKRPVLAMGNTKSKFMFWDLQRMEEGPPSGRDGSETARSADKAASAAEKLSARMTHLRQDAAAREESVGSTASDGSAPASLEKKLQLASPFARARPHKTQMVPRISYSSRQIAFSPGGEWCISVGDQGMIAVTGRWDP
ncbi:WD40-repeat-containing domain protein [Lineolata rhizophorae]|uniref:WD40-repeat-containing domain protein n=1 Tax=Lineolata rhizophorae TaxID=578093 RepID=A0A6A6NUY0_9PEZI|nr:WD40-repeat-containing domain protein [Lineolata rhizophorae]